MNLKNFQRKILKNGMSVLFEERKKTGIVSIAFVVKYGSINESEEEKGIAHFIEHLLYKGTSKRNSKQISEEIEKRGGILNGFTSESITAYWCKLPKKYIHTGLDVLGDMIKNSVFNKKEIEKERKVIFEEIGLYEDTPGLYVHDKILSHLYSGTLGIETIGKRETLSKITRKELFEKFRNIYCPENITLCVVGDANFSEICKFGEKLFKKSEKKIEIPIQKIIINDKETIEKRKGIGQASLIFAYHIPSVSEGGLYSSNILNALMTGGMSSRLFMEIREKRNLAYAIKGNCNCDKDFGYNSIYVGTTKKNVGKVKEIILKELRKIKNLRQKELNEIKEQLIGNNKMSKEDSQSQMLELLYGNLFGNIEEVYNFEEMINKVKLDDIKKLAENALKRNSFFALVPE